MATIPVRWALGILGGVLLCVGLCMSVDASRDPENWFERLLKQIREREEGAMNLQAAFLREVFGWFVSRVDRLFSKPSQLVGASVAICAAPIALSFMFEPASIWIKIIFVCFFLNYGIGALNGDTGATFKLVLTSAFPWAYRWLGTLGDLVEAFRRDPGFYLELTLAGVLVIFAVFGVGALEVIFFTGLNRALARRIISAKKPFIFLSLLLAINCILAAIFLAPLAAAMLIQRVWVTQFLAGNFTDLPNEKALVIMAIGGLLGVLTLLPALATVLIILLMLLPHLHRVAWPLVQLPLYKVRDTVLNPRWLFLAAGGACLLFALPTSQFVKILHGLLP